MNTFPNNAQAIRLVIDENSFSVYLADGRILSVPLAYIHGDDLEEDISVEGLFLGVGDGTRRHLDPSRLSVLTEKIATSPA